MISSTLLTADSLIRLYSGRHVEGPIKLYARLVNNGAFLDNDIYRRHHNRGPSRKGTGDTGSEGTRGDKWPSPRPTLVVMCVATLCWSVMNCFRIKSYRQMQGLSLTVNYIHIPFIHINLSMFNIFNILTPVIGLYGTYTQSGKIIKLFKGALCMNVGLEFGSLIYLMTYAKSLLVDHRQILLLTGVGTIISPSYFHLNSVDIWLLSWVFLAPFKILLKQLFFIRTIEQYENELQQQEDQV